MKTIKCDNEFDIEIDEGMIKIRRDGYWFLIVRTDDAVCKLSHKWAKVAGVTSYATRGEFYTIKEK